MPDYEPPVVEDLTEDEGPASIAAGSTPISTT
jgi:hypothetical protein